MTYNLRFNLSANIPYSKFPSHKTVLRLWLDHKTIVIHYYKKLAIAIEYLEYSLLCLNQKHTVRKYYFPLGLRL